MKMEVTQSIIIVEYMLCFYKNHWNVFFSSDIVDNWACYSKYSRMILNQLLLNINCWVYFYYRIMCDFLIV